jgi:hypothetical protein
MAWRELPWRAESFGEPGATPSDLAGDIETPTSLECSAASTSRAAPAWFAAREQGAATFRRGADSPRSHIAAVVPTFELIIGQYNPVLISCPRTCRMTANDLRAQSRREVHA